MATAAMPAAESYLPASRQMLAGFILALSNFMVVLDLTIANVSIPHIAGNLGISPDQGTWVITSYAVAEGICVPLTGWLSQRFGTVRTFMFSMAGFGLFSFLCGLSTTLGMLVVCRIGQGLCGGPIMPMSQTLMTRVFAPEKQAQAMGLWSMTLLLGPALGPVLGGWISDNMSWHWIFFINVPVAVLCTMAAFALLRPAETERRKLPIDFIGLLLIILWVGCVQILLDLGKDRDWFADPYMVALGVIGAIGFAVFVIWELTEEHPIVNLRVFRHRGYSFGLVTLCLCFGAYFASIVVLPQWLQISMGYTAVQAGLATAVTSFAAILTVPLAARLIPTVDTRILVSLAVAWLGIMALVRTGWTNQATYFDLAMPQFIQGLAFPFFMVPLTAVALAQVKKDEIPAAAGLQNFVRSITLAVATSLVSTLWDHDQRVAHNELTSALQPDDAQRQLSSIGFGMDQIRETIANIVDKETLMIGVNHVFYVSACVFFFGAAVMWLAPPMKGTSGAQMGH